MARAAAVRAPGAPGGPEGVRRAGTPSSRPTPASGPAASERGRRPSRARTPRRDGYHLYCQWAATSSSTRPATPSGRYADFPIGSHPAGLRPRVVARPPSCPASTAAPRPTASSRRSGLGLPPLHPERIREDGYRFLSAALARAFRHAALPAHRPRDGAAAPVHDPRGSGRGAPTSSYRSRSCTRWSLSRRIAPAPWWSARTSARCPTSVRPRMARDRHAAHLGVPVRVDRGRSRCPSRPLLPGRPRHPRPAALRRLPLGRRRRRARAAAACSRPPRQSAEQAAAGGQWRAAAPAAPSVCPTPRTIAAEATAAALEGCLDPPGPRATPPSSLVDLEELWGERAPQNRPGHGAGGARTGAAGAPARSRSSDADDRARRAVLDRRWQTARAVVTTLRHRTSAGCSHRRGSPLVQRGDPPAGSADKLGAHPAARRRRHVRGVGAERRRGQRHRRLQRVGRRARTRSRPAACRASGRASSPEAAHGHVYKFAITTRQGRVLREGRSVRALHRGAAPHGIGDLGPRLRLGRRRLDGARGRRIAARRADLDLRGPSRAAGGATGGPRTVPRLRRAGRPAHRARAALRLHPRRVPAARWSTRSTARGATRRPATSPRPVATATRRT